ncbi:MAG: TonB-dependent receptor [Gammaproteobacteria bacterium]
MLKLIQSRLVVSIIVLSLPAVSLAQALEEITVTAQRRAQSLQDVPVAISAFTDEQAARLGIVETLDLARLVPNFIAHNNTGLGTANTYSIRGLNNTESIATFDPPVGSYVDDFFIQRQNANNYSLFDIERVEVLRGPQGTLFGRNTTGGAVRVLMKDPAEEFGGFAEAGYGRYNRFTVRGSVDFPVSDTLRTKLSAYYIDDDGFVENTVTGEDDINREQNGGVRAAWQWDITGNIQWNASATYINNEHANLLNTLEPGSTDQRVAATNLTSGGAPFANILTGDKRNFGLGNETRSIHFTSDIELDTGLGTVNILTSYLDLDQEFALDFFNSSLAPMPTGAFTVVNDGEHEQFSQEVKISGSGLNDSVDYVAGFFYFNEDNRTDFASYNIFATFSGNAPLEYDRVLDNGVDSWAVYAQIDYHLTESLTFVAGLRYTDEQKDFGVTANNPPGMRDNTMPTSAQTAGLIGDTEILAEGIPLKQSTDLVTPRFAIEFKPNDDLLLYVSATRGFKSGGWNARGVQAERLLNFAPEKVWNYEGGMRSEWLDGKLRINLTGFYTDISDYQLPSAFETATGGIAFITRNFADLEVYGFEAEITAHPMEELTVFANIGIQDARYNNLDPAIVAQQARCNPGVLSIPNPVLDPDDPMYNPDAPNNTPARIVDPMHLTGMSPNAGLPRIAVNCAQGIVNPIGNIAPPVRAPEHQIAIGGWYTYRLTENMNIIPTINITDYGKHNISTSGQDVALIDGYTLVNGGVSLEHTEQQWTVTASCKNCTDQEYYVSYLAGTRYFSDPATWSITFNKRF